MWVLCRVWWFGGLGFGDLESRGLGVWDVGRFRV